MSKIRKFLVTSDGSEECMTAVRYAALRTRAIKGGLVLLGLAEHNTSFGHWRGVDQQIRREARQAASIRTGEIAGMLKTWCGVEPEIVIYDTDLLKAVREILEKDPAIWVLCLGSGPDGKPGTLVSLLGRGQRITDRPLAVTVLPFGLSDSDIIELGGGL